MKTIEKQIADLKTARKIILGVAKKMGGVMSLETEVAGIYDVALTLLDVTDTLKIIQKLIDGYEE